MSIGRKKKGKSELVLYAAPAAGSNLPFVKVHHDLRIVFAMQLAAVLAVVAILTLLNAAGVN